MLLAAFLVQVAGQLHVYPAGGGVYGVFHQLFHHGEGPLNHLAGGNLAGG